MRKRTTSAIKKSWSDVEKLFAKWDAEGWPEYEDEKQDRPTPPIISDSHYTDAAQLVATWKDRQEHE